MGKMTFSQHFCSDSRIFFAVLADVKSACRLSNDFQSEIALNSSPDVLFINYIYILHIIAL